MGGENTNLDFCPLGTPSPQGRRGDLPEKRSGEVALTLWISLGVGGGAGHFSKAFWKK